MHDAKIKGTPMALQWKWISFQPLVLPRGSHQYPFLICLFRDSLCYTGIYIQIAHNTCATLSYFTSVLFKQLHQRSVFINRYLARRTPRIFHIIFTLTVAYELHQCLESLLVFRFMSFHFLLNHFIGYKLQSTETTHSVCIICLYFLFQAVAWLSLSPGTVGG